MKKIALLAGVALLLSATMSCSSDGAKTSTDKNDTTVVKKRDPFEAKTNIRYIDMDSISENYHLAKDYKEWLISKNQSLENQIKGVYTEVKNFEAACNKKMQSNQYLTEESYKADMQKGQTMAMNAAKKEQELRLKATEEDNKWQKQLLDSINSYVIDYNKEKKYDAILFKSAGVYFNPSLDITDEIVEGLNERYNKVESKKEEAKTEKTDTTSNK